MDDFARDLRGRLRTQDNRATSHPIFTVEQRGRIWGVADTHTETFLWLDDEGQEVTELAAEALEARARAGAAIPTGYTRLGYRDTWDFVTACLTEAGAQAYIDANGHNLKEPRIYVASGYRNEEWIALRDYFLKRGGEGE